MTLPRGRIIKVEFEVCLPEAATKEQVDEWVAFELGAGSMPLDNPLRDSDLEFWRDSPMLTDTGMVGRIEDFGHAPQADGSTTFHRRYVREIV